MTAREKAGHVNITRPAYVTVLMASAFLGACFGAVMTLLFMLLSDAHDPGGAIGVFFSVWFTNSLLIYGHAIQRHEMRNTVIEHEVVP